MDIKLRTRAIYITKGKNALGDTVRAKSQIFPGDSIICKGDFVLEVNNAFDKDSVLGMTERYYPKEAVIVAILPASSDIRDRMITHDKPLPYFFKQSYSE